MTGNIQYIILRSFHMEKKILLIKAMIFSILLIMCLNLTAEDQADQRESTPENSVLVYGGIGDQTAKVRFTQTDPKFKPGTYEAWSLRFYFDDIEPGSYLKLTYYESRAVLVSQSFSPVTGWTVSTGNRYSIGRPGLQGSTPVDFRVPSKPGLYYIGCKSEGVVDGVTTFVPATWAKRADDPEKEYELFVLKRVLKKKKGTAWEPVIHARMKELGYDK